MELEAWESLELEELGWETLDLRRWSRRLVLFYKIVNNITPAYTRDPIPHLHELPYSFRARAAIGQIYARTDKYKSTFYPHCLAEWENIDPETRNAPSQGRRGRGAGGAMAHPGIQIVGFFGNLKVSSENH